MTVLNATQFLNLVWPKKLLRGETLELRAIYRTDGSVRRIFCSTIEEFLETSEKMSDHDIYFGISTRFNKGGRKVDCYRLGTLWCDLDGKKISNCNFQPQPDILVNSGGGVHAYWLLKNPALIRGERWEEVEKVTRGIARKFGGDINTVDVSRILRVPGFFNHKYHPPREVKAYAL